MEGTGMQFSSSVMAIPVLGNAAKDRSSELKCEVSKHVPF